MNEDNDFSAVIIDDHPMARMAIKILLESNNINVLAEAETGKTGLKLFDTLKPDIAVIDVDLPLQNGIDIVEEIRKNDNHCIVIVISSEPSFTNSKRSADVGAHAFIPKNKEMKNIISAINAAINGFTYFPITFNKFIGSSSSEQEKLASLSNQEVKVMNYLLKGYDITFIADEMYLSKTTVHTYKSRLLAKLGCSNLVELYAFSKANEIG
jgi:two-component system response regulator EvgA